ncbi:hypothetical protein GW17_00009338 [Ensete ventricosum]|nr:hypothetical protein GW17_00009338 [Ensete ventricosum]
MGVSDEGDMNIGKLPRLFDSSNFFIDSILVAGYQGQPLADHPSVKNSRAPKDRMGPACGVDLRFYDEDASLDIACIAGPRNHFTVSPSGTLSVTLCRSMSQTLELIQVIKINSNN